MQVQIEAAGEAGEHRHSDHRDRTGDGQEDADQNLHGRFPTEAEAEENRDSKAAQAAANNSRAGRKILLLSAAGGKEGG
jgi:hypothetical protein